MSHITAGAQLYTVRSFCQDIEGVSATLTRVAAIGYKAVQISGFGPVDVCQVARLLDDTGLSCVATHVNWTRFREDLDAVIEQHRLWKCPHPAIGGLPRDYYSPDGLRRFIDELGPVVEKLAAADMDFSYHNHSRELARVGPNGTTWLEALYDLAPPELLKAEIDTYWIQHGGGDPADWVRRCAGRQPLLHVKDMIVTVDGEQRFAEIGAGNLNWDAILSAARASGVDYALVEQDRCYDRDPFDSLAISLRNLAAMGVG